MPCFQLILFLFYTTEDLNDLFIFKYFIPSYNSFNSYISKCLLRNDCVPCNFKQHMEIHKKLHLSIDPKVSAQNKNSINLYSKMISGTT